MAEGAGFWLPSEFFDDILLDKENFDKNQSAESDSEFGFPTEFPFDFGTNRDENLEKPWVMSTSPQSTLASWSSGGSGNGSPNGVLSPTSERNDAVGDLIYAGRVAKLKLSGNDLPGPTKFEGLLGPPKPPNPPVVHNICLQNQKQGCGMWQSEAAMYQMRPRIGQEAWPVQLNSGRIVGTGARAVVIGGSFSGGGGCGAAAKRGCAGTGVFLPRRYGSSVFNASSMESRKRPGLSAASTPSKNVHYQNKNLDNMPCFPQPQPHLLPKLSRGVVSEYDLLMARRNAIMLQHRRSLLLEGSSLMNRSMYLPQERTY